MELEKPFVLKRDHIQPACLPTKPVKIGARCFTSGWGKTENGNPEELMATDTIIQGREQCPLYMSELYFCGISKEASTCHGDSGGPLVCEENGVAVLHGVNSYIVKDYPPCTVGKPNMFTDVYDNLVYILTTIVSF